MFISKSSQSKKLPVIKKNKMQDKIIFHDSLLRRKSAVDSVFQKMNAKVPLSSSLLTTKKMDNASWRLESFDIKKLEARVISFIQKRMPRIKDTFLYARTGFSKLI